MSDKTTPTPGSENAISMGCKCPRIDNHYGAGIPSKDGPQFWINASCPVHNPIVDEGATFY